MCICFSSSFYRSTNPTWARNQKCFTQTFTAAQQATTDEKALTQNEGLGWFLTWLPSNHWFYISLHMVPGPGVCVCLAGWSVCSCVKSKTHTALYTLRTPVPGSICSSARPFCQRVSWAPLVSGFGTVTPPLARQTVHHSNDMRLAGIAGLLLLLASSRFLCQMMAENLDAVWNL